MEVINVVSEMESLIVLKFTNKQGWMVSKYQESTFPLLWLISHVGSGNWAQFLMLARQEYC